MTNQSSKVHVVCSIFECIQADLHLELVWKYDHLGKDDHLGPGPSVSQVSFDLPATTCLTGFVHTKASVPPSPKGGSWERPRAPRRGQHWPWTL